MEIKATLNKPYTDKAKADFIVKNNHNKGYEITETETELQAWGYTEEEQQEQQQQKESEEKELALQAAIEELGKEMAKADLAGNEEWKADLRAEYETLIMESEE